MQLDLHGKRALVTGSSSGIGRMIALRLAAEGVEVIVHGRNPERTERTAQELRDAGHQAETVIGDLMNEVAAQEVVRQVTSYGGIDILINNAGGRHGGWQRSGWFGTSPANWIETYKQNVISTATLIDGLVPGMTERGWGRVIQIASAVAIHQPPNFPDYQAAKAAEINLSKSLSRGLSGTGVTSNSISAGIIHTPGSDAEIESISEEVGFGKNWRDHEKDIALNIFKQSVGRIGREEDISSAVCFLSSRHADFITGINLIIDGGM